MTLASVKLWGTRVGGVSLDPGKQFGTFQYDPDFVPSGIEISPISMPLSGLLLGDKSFRVTVLLGIVALSLW
jgi:serine/threonine-protein kinase HipA